MFITNRVFVDSSVLIEYRKGTKTELLEFLFENNFTPVIGQPVLSEFLYHNLAIFSGKSPLSVKTSNQISTIVSKSDPLGFLGLFSYLTDYDSMLQEAIDIMGNYNLLPNDAAILALCKHHDIKFLASFDSDFNRACEGLGITLVQETSQLKR